MSPHKLPESESSLEDIIDPVEAMLEKTGCILYHYKVQECIANTQDWRKCQDQVQEFRACMAKFSERQQKEAENK